LFARVPTLAMVKQEHKLKFWIKDHQAAVHSILELQTQAI
jgi:hypothetical protein